MFLNTLSKDYRLVILSKSDAAKKMQKGQVAGEEMQLKNGWNLVTKQIDGKPVSVLVYAGDAAKEKVAKPGAKGKY